MIYQKEPSYSHGQPAKTGILYCNLGTPQEPTAPALRHYLGQFLADPRVVEIPKWIWMLILHGIILRVRPKKSAEKYATIWTPNGSPLKVWTETQAQLLQQKMQAAGHHVSVRYAMRYGQPSVAAQMDAFKAEGCTRVLVFPAYPQYSGATSASVFDMVYQWAGKVRTIPELRFINHYHDDPRHIAALAQSVRRHWEQNGQPEHLVMSFHGMPERTLHLGDPYHCECHKTGRLLAEALSLSKDQYTVTFQSRFGKAKWIEPYTEPTLVAMAEKGVKHVHVICPGFSADCIETLEEINQEAREAFLHAGGREFDYISCLNDDATGMNAMAQLCEQHLQGWPTRDLPDAASQQATRERAMAKGAKF